MDILVNDVRGSRCWAARFGLKLEVFIPFILADGGGALGTFSHALVVGFATVIINSVAEDYFTKAARRRRYVSTLVSGLIIVALNGAMLYWWTSNRMLRNPIASYGPTATIIVTGITVLGIRLGLMFADDTSEKSGAAVELKS